MSIKTLVLHLFSLGCITVSGQPVQLDKGVHPYVVFFHYDKVGDYNISIMEANLKTYYPSCGTIIHHAYVLTAASYFITLPKLNASEWRISGYHENAVGLNVDHLLSIETLEFIFHESFTPTSDPYVPYNLCLVKLKRTKDTAPLTFQAQISWHVKYSNNRKAYPDQHVSTISIVYWSFQLSTKTVVKYQYDFEPHWVWEIGDHPCEHVHDKVGTALYCLKKPTDTFGKHYPCASNTVTEGAPILIDSEVNGVFIGISTLKKCNLPITSPKAGALPGIGVAVINSYQKVSPEHKIAQDFLKRTIGTEYNYTDEDLGWKIKTNGKRNISLLAEEKDNADIFGYKYRNLPKCVMDGSSDLLIQKLVIIGGVFFSLYVAIHFSYLF
ncbi:uncharacterized protein LOC123014753 [Tribolium madens]|uniref:uncharacterized protein LOC123014753 n=1 Tax=Tribolium madens TaxID=41895 RepID=UPI001CF7342B|nr:uncharacterized protein LOC123014753 [Tribolium madens]